MFLTYGIAMGAMSAVTSSVMEAKAFQEQIAAMPEDQRAAAIQAREYRRLERQRQHEHAEMVEALKPHTLWSFLGMSRK